MASSRARASLMRLAQVSRRSSMAWSIFVFSCSSAARASLASRVASSSSRSRSDAGARGHGLGLGAGRREHRICFGAGRGEDRLSLGAGRRGQRVRLGPIRSGRARSTSATGPPPGSPRLPCRAASIVARASSWSRPTSLSLVASPGDERRCLAFRVFLRRLHDACGGREHLGDDLFRSGVRRCGTGRARSSAT